MLPSRMADERFGSRPDLLVVDGGKPQLTAAIEATRLLGSIYQFVAWRRRPTRKFCALDETPVVLPTEVCFALSN